MTLTDRFSKALRKRSHDRTQHAAYAMPPTSSQYCNEVVENLKIFSIACFMSIHYHMAGKNMLCSLILFFGVSRQRYR